MGFSKCNGYQEVKGSHTLLQLLMIVGEQPAMALHGQAGELYIDQDCG